MATVSEALALFEAKASTARARYHKAVAEGVNPREARRAHDQARQQAFIDLVGEVRDRQAELGELLDESRWTTLADSQAAPGYQDELEDGHALTRDFGTRVRLGKLWDLGAERQQQPPGERQAANRPAVGSVDAAAGGQQPQHQHGIDMNDLIRGR